MPTDTSDFTLSLFDNTALSGWTHPAPPAVADSYEADGADADDADEDGDTPPLAAAPVARGSNFHLAGDRDACPRLAGAGARQHRRDQPVEDAGAIGPRTDPGRAGAAAALHRLRRYGAGAELLPPPRRGRIPAGLAGDRRGARSRRHAGGIRRPATRHAVCPLHAGDDHPWTLASRRAAGLYRGPRAGTRHGHRPVLRPVARRAARQPASSPASNTTRSPPASRAWCIPKRWCGARTTRGANWPGASTSRSATRRSPIAWCGPIPSRAPWGCGCTITSSPARSRGCAPAGSRCSSPAPARWTRPAPRRGNTSPAWPTWWARCGCPRAACARARAPTW